MKLTNKKIINKFLSHMLNLTFNLFSVENKTEKISIKYEILRIYPVGTPH